MRSPFRALLAVTFFFAAPNLGAQTPCPTLSVVVNTPEDELMLAVNGAENPQEQIAALEKFTQEHADSKFLPCVNEYLTSTYLKLNNYEKAIEYGEKDVAANYYDLNLAINLLKAYMASGKVSDSAFDMIIKAPDEIKSETLASRPAKASDAEWQKMQEEMAAQAKDARAFIEYALYQLLPRVTDANKRLQFLEGFSKSFTEPQNPAKLDLQFSLAYQMAGNSAKASEFGEKAIAADPNDPETLNAVADYYATVLQSNLDKASEYAKKALELAPALKKPEGMSDEQFKAIRDTHLGWAHLNLGYVAYLKGAKAKKFPTAIQEFKTAADILGANPTLQGRTLFYLGYAYEAMYPANHKLASEALGRCAGIASPWQGQAQDLLAKVRKVAGN